MDTPWQSFYTEDQKIEVLAEVRGLLDEYPFLRDRGTETVQRYLLTTRGLIVSGFEVVVALEGITVEGEVLA